MTAPVGPVPHGETWRMEEFSYAYLHAVAASANCKADRPKVDDDSIDVTLSRSSPLAQQRAPKLDIQLKATYTDILRADHVAYALPLKNYNDLRDPLVMVPRILVVVLIPDTVDAWLAHSEDKMSLHRCGYWVSLRGAPDVANETSRTVHLPRSQVFDVAGLSGIFSRLEVGSLP